MTMRPCPPTPANPSSARLQELRPTPRSWTRVADKMLAGFFEAAFVLLALWIARWAGFIILVLPP